MLSVITLMVLITAHAAPDTLEMEHHAVVNYQANCILKWLYPYSDWGTKLSFCCDISNILGGCFVLSKYFLIPFSFQILTSVQPSPIITVMSMLSVITLMDRITAHAALDTLEMEHHALVNHKLYPAHLTLYDLLDTEAAH